MHRLLVHSPFQFIFGPLHFVRLFHFTNIIILCANMSVLHIHFAYFLFCFSRFSLCFCISTGWLFRCPIAYGKYSISPFCFHTLIFSEFAAVCSRFFTFMNVGHKITWRQIFVLQNMENVRITMKKRRHEWSTCATNTQTLWAQFSGIFFIFPVT